MASNFSLLTAGFSAVLGANVVPQESGGQQVHTISDVFTATYSLTNPQRGAAQPTDPVNRLAGGGLRGVCSVSFDELDPGFDYDFSHVEDDGKKVSPQGFAAQRTYYECTTMQLADHLAGGDLGGVCSVSFDELDPEFDYDFSHVEDDGKKYMRGGFQYERPYGWKRIAIKVVGKYADDTWLGPKGIRTEEAPGEWPVSYHGTNMKSAKMILKEGYKAGPRQLYGRGIYTSPSLEMVERLYAKEFSFEGKTYKIALQNRVNPNQKSEHLKIIPASQTSVGADYWLSPGGTADVRPYGILIREVSN